MSDVQQQVSELADVHPDIEVFVRQAPGTWRDFFTKDYWKEWFIPPETDGDEVYKKVKDPTLEHDGYQQAAWEEEAELLYVDELQQAQQADLHSIQQLEWLSICCNDEAGAPVVVVCPDRLEQAGVDSERLYQHFIVTMDKLVDAPYSVLIAIEPGNSQLSGQVLALRPFYERLPVKYKLRLTKVLLMFSNTGLRASMTLSCPFFSHSFWGKCMFIQQLDDLWHIIEREKIFPYLPEAVQQVGTSNRDATQQLSDLSRLEDVGVAVDQPVGDLSDVC